MSERTSSPSSSSPADPSQIRPSTPAQQPTARETERARLVQALNDARGNERAAAEALGLTVTALKRKIDRHRLTPYLVHVYSQYPHLTWGMMVAREPKLQTLLDDAKRFARLKRRYHRKYGGCTPERPHSRWCPVAWWSGCYPHRFGTHSANYRLSELTGPGREDGDPLLGSRAARELSFDMIYHQTLPYCCDCCCMAV
jgi:hypothetical protein